MAVVITKVGDIVNPLIERHGSLTGFRKAMEDEGVTVTDNTVRGWTRGARVTRPTHFIALARMSGKPEAEVLRAALSPEEDRELFSDATDDGEQ